MFTPRHSTDLARGTLMSHTVQNGSQSPLQSQHYQWDAVGNLIERRDTTLGLTETFQYDSLDRLKTSTLALTQSDILTGAIATSHQYDAIGNLKAKGAGITGYQYGQQQDGTLRKPHAVNQVTVSGTTKTYQYDANGNLTDSGTRHIDWSSYNKPLQITDGTQQSTFAYGPDRARYQHIRTDSSGTTTTTYIGQAYERIEQSGKDTLHRYNLHVGNQVIAVHDITTKESDDATTLAFQTRYLHRDHLGSVSLITDNNGEVIERLNYDPWGQRRDMAALATLASSLASQLAANDSGINDDNTLASELDNNSDANDGSTLTTSGAGIDLSQSLIATVFEPKWHTFHRGYTGHEMLDHLNLIHMNGRIYDPEIGRFLSADPFVQFPESTQGFNRYTYVGNNPLSYTDPSGFFSLKKALKKIAGIAGAVIGAAACIGTAGIGCAVAAGAITGAVGGYLATGTLEGALIGAALGAASAFVAGQVGNHFGETGFADFGKHLAKSIVHGVTQGALSKAGGGRFGDGFLGAFASNIASPLTNSIGGNSASDSAARVTVAAVIGGTASKLGGGNFANGAITAAFVQAFNAEMHRENFNARSEKSVLDKISESFEAIGDSIELDVGVGPGLKAKINLFGIQAKAGLDVNMGLWGDLAGDGGGFYHAEASLLEVAIGKHRLGLSAGSYTAKWGDVPGGAIETIEPAVVGYSHGAKSAGFGTVGVSATAVVIRGSMTIDFIGMYRNVEKVWTE